MGVGIVTASEERRHGTVLVVDDEAIVRMTGADMLEDAGFRVLEAGSADEAVRILEEADDVQVVFSDVRMPGSMDGVALAELVHRRWPNIGILLTSGHTVLGRRELPEGGHFLPKPYRLSLVLDEVCALMAERPIVGRN